MDIVLMRRDDCVIMRRWEAVIYRVIDRTITAFTDLFSLPRGPYIKVKEALMRLFEFYLAEDGSVRLRCNSGKQGVYKFLDGKLVKISGNAEMTLDNYSILPWKECNAGYYDEELGAHVESKQHYRRLMKEKGLIALEPDRYCGSQTYRKEQWNKEDRAKRIATTEKAFISACQKYAPFGFDEKDL